MVKALLPCVAIAAALLLQFEIIAAQDHHQQQLRHHTNHVEAVIDVLSRNNTASCNSQTAAYRQCMSASGDDSSVDCAQCMTTGLDVTKPITCGLLRADAYCPRVAACVDAMCTKKRVGTVCREEYYAGLNCAIQQTCSDVRCSSSSREGDVLRVE
mmetsp:Transcript_31223/g.75490  ORF Transcript_31223/g.75490 Transcript_31223/m.75490 type:complete len:156 (-) Transcript_31223:283-750(-)|eukprot:CAMPEP_0181109056 /NCGR_PEP_ID=MMETSP1071-20121207/17970_1 /TAXON_ID=35127 /ORGANISM="Thalassiosira sp., Strain NH16" /LENGTH=155 /DNA_ID=CAMNT_0023192721 /DNA_START=14 /DNA_END=481 /DNA_ORIENTATION=-